VADTEVVADLLYLKSRASLNSCLCNLSNSILCNEAKLIVNDESSKLNTVAPWTLRRCASNCSALKTCRSSGVVASPLGKELFAEATPLVPAILLNEDINFRSLGF
jgi:hypothetical protein